VEKRLLVVDDEIEFGDYVRRVAVDLGFEVTVTSGAREFMAVYRNFDPTVIVMDIVMPEIEGLELVQWLADNDCAAAVIVATGFAPNYAEIAEKLGAARGIKKITTLNKPVRATVLRTALTQALA
jgi:FixJ family two-component response regulator